MNKLVSLMASLFLIISITNVSASTVKIGAGDPKGVYYPTSIALCKEIHELNQGIDCEVEATDGSVENLSKLHAGEIQISMAQADTIWGLPQGKREKLRTLAKLHPESLALVVKQESGIKFLNDLKGKRLYIGKPKSGTKKTVTMLLDACRIEIISSGIQHKKVADTFLENKIDGIFYLVGQPSSEIQEIRKESPINLVPIQGHCVNKAMENQPYLTKVSIPGSLYAIRDTPSIGVNAYLVTTKSLPDGLAALVNKAVLNALPGFTKYHPALWSLTEASIQARGIVPYHKGIDSSISVPTIQPNINSVGLLTTIAEGMGNIGDLVDYLESAPDHEKLWPAARYQLNVMTRNIMEQCHEPECESFEREMASLLQGNLASLREMQTAARLYLQTLSFKIEKDLNEARLMHLVWIIGLIILSLLIVVAALWRDGKIHKQMALVDPLTGSATRRAFILLLEKAIAKAKRDKGSLVLFYLDLNLFKWINDNLGHAAGDRFLKEVVERLKKILRESDSIARIGGDEFALILPMDPKYVSVLMEKIAKAFKKPFVWNGYDLYISASIGVAVYSYDAQDVETLMSRADDAMYRAKDLWRENGANVQVPVTWRSFSEKMLQEQQEKERQRRNLKEALASTDTDEPQLSVAFQTVVDIKTGLITKTEALLRWVHPERGNVRPDLFIAWAEETGLIVPIGRWVVTEACRQIKEWREAGVQTVPVTINISGLQFERDPELANFILLELEKYGLENEAMEIELTENCELTPLVEERLKEFKSLFQVLLDDFGTSWSGLSHLKKGLFSGMKMDRQFTTDIGLPESLVPSISSAARALKLDFIAEGMETLSQLRALEKLGLNMGIQGYFFSRPLPPKNFADLLVNQPGSMQGWIDRHQQNA